MTNSDWQKILSTDKSYKAEIVKEFLADHEIQSVILNKRDSSYNNFGNYEIFVPNSDKEKAQSLINEHVSFQ
jgi:hypothetical protein